FFFSSRRRHTMFSRDWSSDVCSSDLYIRFEKSDIVLNQEHWTMNQDAELRVSKGKFYFDDLRLTRDRQEVALNGMLSNENDNLRSEERRVGKACRTGWWLCH